MRANPLRPLQENIRRALVQHHRASRKAILCVIHAPIHAEAAGGTEITCRNLVEHLPGLLKYVLYPDDLLLCLEEHSPLGQWTYKYVRSWTQPHLLTDAETERIFLQILDEFQIDIVHFHHLYSLPLSLVRLARERGPKVFLTCHDGYYACVQRRLLDRELDECSEGGLCGYSSTTNPPRGGRIGMRLVDAILGARRLRGSLRPSRCSRS